MAQIVSSYLSFPSPVKETEYKRYYNIGKSYIMESVYSKHGEKISCYNLLNELPKEEDSWKYDWEWEEEEE
jgi:hypothetical protein